jgi:hypothetical protein
VRLVGRIACVAAVPWPLELLRDGRFAPLLSDAARGP